MSEETVKVLVRCRPLNTREKNLNCECVVRMDPSSGLVQLSKPKSSDPPKSFTFDGSYYVDSNSKTIYEELGFPLVESVLQGYNGTVFAYGQAGALESGDVDQNHSDSNPSHPLLCPLDWLRQVIYDGGHPRPARAPRRYAAQL